MVSEKRVIKILLLTLIGVFVICLAYIGWNWSILSQSTRISVATATLGVLGTLILAVATFWTVHQNRRLIEARMREREKPLAKEELDEFVEPAIRIVESNISTVEEDKSLEWINITPRKVFSFNDNPAILETEVQLVFVPADPLLQDRITAEVPDLSESIEEHNQMVERFLSLRQDAIREMEEPVKRFLEEKDYIEEFEGDEMKRLLDAVFEQNEIYTDHEKFWEAHGDDLVAMAHDEAAESLDQINQEVDEYHSICDSLYEKLRSRKTELKEEYGIISDFDPDEDLVSVV